VPKVKVAATRPAIDAGKSLDAVRSRNAVRRLPTKGSAMITRRKLEAQSIPILISLALVEGSARR
jgi:hypothetical protein